METREVFDTEEEAITAPETANEIAKRGLFAKRCCILCDGSNRCGANVNEKREAFYTEEEVLDTPEDF